MVVESMSTEEYIFDRLEHLSKTDQILANDFEANLGTWCTVTDAAKYLKKHKNTIYDRVNNQEVLSKKFSNRKLIYSPSLVLLLTDDDYLN